MILHVHFSSTTLLNTYLIGPEDGGDAVLIDPSAMDVQLLKLIESNRFYVRSILLTRPRHLLASGIKTLLKIYDAEVFAGASAVAGQPCTRVSDGRVLGFRDIDIEVIDPGDFAAGALIFHAGGSLFTGELIEAGSLYATSRRSVQFHLARAVEDRILSLDPETMVFPAMGPPSTIRAERRFNPLD